MVRCKSVHEIERVSEGDLSAAEAGVARQQGGGRAGDERGRVVGAAWRRWREIGRDAMKVKAKAVEKQRWQGCVGIRLPEEKKERRCAALVGGALEAGARC